MYFNAILTAGNGAADAALAAGKTPGISGENGGWASVGKNPDGHAFASLIAALLGMPQNSGTALGTGFLSGLETLLFAASSSGESADAEGAGGAEAEDLLQQLAAWIAALTAEQRQTVAANAEVGAWIAMAESELMMADLFTLPTDRESPAAEDGNRKDALSAAVARLTEALPLHPDRQVMAAVLRQGVDAVAKAFAEAYGAASESARLPDGNADGGMQNALRLLAKLNGAMTSANQSEARTPAQSNLLSMLEAKAPLVHIARLGTNLAGSESAHATAADRNAAEGQTDMSFGLQFARAAGGAVRAESLPEQPVRVPFAQLAERVGDWMTRMAASGGNVRAETVLRLVPEHLGAVEVKLSIQNGQLTASIAAETAVAKEALEANLAVLRTNLQQQGVAVERLVVTQLNSAESFAGLFQDGKHQQRQSPGHGSARPKTEDAAAEDWSELAMLEIDPQGRLLTAHETGGTFQATA